MICQIKQKINFINKINYKPECIETYACGKNKSKYLIPLHLKLYLVQTEENELVYIIEIINNNSYKEEIYRDFNVNDNENICSVLTNNNLIIQTFTSNCVDILKFNSNIINSNYDIISFIKHFDDEFQLNNNVNKDSTNSTDRTNNNENNKIKGSDNNINSIKNSLEKLKSYKLILKTKFHNPRKIVWRNEIYDKESILYIDKIKNKSLSMISHDNEDKTNNNNIYEQKFLMMVREIYISDKIVGYYFYFKKIKCIKEFNKIKTINDKTKINNSLNKI